MKKYFYSILILSFAGIFLYSFSKVNNRKNILKTENEVAVTMATSFYTLNIKSLDEKQSIDFKDFKGKKVLCVNVASECGYTKQYAALQELANKYQNKLVIIGFPCNQFGGQEPGSAEEIQSFCKKNYGVTFLITEKIEVKGENQHPIYQWLTQQKLNGKSDAEIKWNFNKFLIDENGNWVAYFPSKVDPMSEEITGKL